MERENERRRDDISVGPGYGMFRAVDRTRTPPSFLDGQKASKQLRVTDRTLLIIVTCLVLCRQFVIRATYFFVRPPPARLLNRVVFRVY